MLQMLYCRYVFYIFFCGFINSLTKMISIAMKNGILLLLIILITHFLINNYLIDNMSKDHTIITGNNGTNITLKEPFTFVDPPQTMVQQEKEDQVIFKTQSEEEDLYKYVFNTNDLTSKDVDNSEYTFIDEQKGPPNQKIVPELKNDLGFKDVTPFDTFTNFSSI